VERTILKGVVNTNTNRRVRPPIIKIKEKWDFWAFNHN